MNYQKTLFLIFTLLTSTFAYPVVQTPVRNISSIAQKDLSCGYHSLINAKVIDDLLEQDIKINSEIFPQYAQKYQSFIGKDILEIYQILNLAEQLSVEKIYFLQINNDQVSAAGTDDYVTNSLQEALESLINSQNNGRIHCICNTGGHWILISVVKQDSTITLYHLDSGSIYNISTPAEKFIQYIQSLVDKVKS